MLDNVAPKDIRGKTVDACGTRRRFGYRRLG
jgi:hypothetical protein